MPYVPTNVAAYTASFAGAIAGMAVSGWITDPTAADYNNVTLVAGAFAQAFDTVWNNATQLNNLEVEAITAVVQQDFRGRGPSDSVTLQSPTNWTVAARACAALVLESDIYFAGQGINPGTPGGGSGPAPAVSHLVYVELGGNDVTGDGSSGKPFASINKACALIRSFANASSTNRYGVFVGPGRFTEALVLSEWTYIVGFSTEGTRVTFTSITLGAEWTVNVDHRSGFQNMTVSGGTTINFNAVSSNQGKVRFDQVTFNDKWHYVAFSAINQILLDDCFLFDGYTQTGINLVAWASTISGNIAMTSVNDGRNLPTLAAFVGSGVASLTQTWTASGGANQVTSAFQGTGVVDVLTLDGAQASVDATSTPIAFPAGVTLLNGAPDPRKNLTGAKGGNAALASVCTQLAATGAFKDSTT